MAMINMHEQAIKLMNKNYTKIKHNPHILLNYALMYMKQGNYTKAITILNRAEKVGCSTNILYNKALCYEMMKNYELAEHTYKQSINRNPIMLYPYYRLVKLYSNAAFFDKEKLETTARIALEKKLKIESKTTNIMKNEIREILTIVKAKK